MEKETNLPSIDEDIYNKDVIHSNKFIVNGKSNVDLTTSDSDSSQGSDSDFNQVVSKFKKNCDDYEEHVSQTILDSIEKSKKTRKLIEDESKKLYNLQELDIMSMSNSISTQELIPMGVMGVEINVMNNKRNVTSSNNDFI